MYSANTILNGSGMTLQWQRSLPHKTKLMGDIILKCRSNSDILL